MNKLLENIIKIEERDIDLPRGIGLINSQFINATDEKLINKIKETVFEQKGFRYSKSDLGFFDFLKQRRGDCLNFSLLYYFIFDSLSLKSDIIAAPFHTLVKFYGEKKDYLIETTDGDIEEPKFYIKNFNIHQSSINKEIYLIKLNPDQIASLYINKKAKRLIKNKNYPKALKILEEAYSYCARIPELCYNIGWIYKQLGNFKEAKRFFKKSVYLHPNFAESYNNLGACYAMEGNSKKAKACFKKSLSLEDSIEARENLKTLQ